MKKSTQTLTRFLLLTALCVLPAAAQQFTPATVTTIPPVIWTGTNAQAIVRQLLAITNANGRAVVPPGLLTNRINTINLMIRSNTNGVQSLRATIR